MKPTPGQKKIHPLDKSDKRKGRSGQPVTGGLKANEMDTVIPLDRSLSGLHSGLVLRML